MSRYANPICARKSVRSHTFRETKAYIVLQSRYSFPPVIKRVSRDFLAVVIQLPLNGCSGSHLADVELGEVQSFGHRTRGVPVPAKNSFARKGRHCFCVFLVLRAIGPHEAVLA